VYPQAGAVLEKNIWGQGKKVDAIFSRRTQKAGNRGHNYQINQSNPPKRPLYNCLEVLILM